MLSLPGNQDLKRKTEGEKGKGWRIGDKNKASDDKKKKALESRNTS